jgi:alpha-glucuronidase
MKCAALFVIVSIAQAETGQEAWLRYRPLSGHFPSVVVKLGDAPEIDAAQRELWRAIFAFSGKLPDGMDSPAVNSLVLGTTEEVKRVMPGIVLPELSADGFLLRQIDKEGQPLVLITSPSARGVLYGTFAWIRRVMESTPPVSEVSNPAMPIRWVNQWDNLDGTIERGYAGRSIFFDNNNVVADLTRAGEYARLLASVGINGCTVNNVNANARVLTSDFLPQIARIADAFRPWGVRLSLSADFASPKTIGGLDTFDPLDGRVIAWWKAKADEIYKLIPDFAGFVLKADSEGRVGPSTYGRTHAQAANLLANALQPHGGVLIYRGFVYDHHADWRNLKNDRARAAYDNFQPLDGQFAQNAAVQVKHGPIDFQAREPVSPLIGDLKNTNQTLELQITQEYTGQQRHLCYLAPMWKQVLDFDLRVDNGRTPVKKLVARPLGGLVGVANVGRDANWLGHDLAMANLYAFGRLAWDPDLSAETIAEEWTSQTFGGDKRVISTVSGLLMDSWPTYEGYTGPLGLGTLTDILRGHYGPGIESAERNGWGQWIRADHDGIGMDRTVATGTGYIGQYPAAVARRYESINECPDELLLFMHHLPYTHLLHSGKTIIQHVYDSHYAAAEEAQRFPLRWRALDGLIDPERSAAVMKRLEYQAGHAIVWRDAICSWFQRESGIPDARGRAGHFPGRTEAEAMDLDGYAIKDVTPWEDASGGKAVACEGAPKSCSASFVFHGVAGRYDIAVQYFDVNSGDGRFKLSVGQQVLQTWIADDHFPTKALNGDSSTRQTIHGVKLRPNDLIRIEGSPDGGDSAAIDYIEVRESHE